MHCGQPKLNFSQVQRYIEQCIRYFLNKDETKYLLQAQANVEPEFTALGIQLNSSSIIDFLFIYFIFGSLGEARKHVSRFF